MRWLSTKRPIDDSEMKNVLKHGGAVVPLVTPFTAGGGLDEDALERLVAAQVAGGVAGVFVLGTTGEGARVPADYRRRLVELTVQHAAGRTLVYAGLGDMQTPDVAEANEFLKAGAVAVVAHPPISQKVPVAQLSAWYEGLLNEVAGPMLLYNMPMTTGVSISMESVGQLLGHPKLAGIKDSENDPKRQEELLRRYGGRADFSVFVGVGALMEKGLKWGADGIVPSVGNLIPAVCQELWAAAKRADWVTAEKLSGRMHSVAALYQQGRNLNESLAALKAALQCRGLCSARMLPPLRKVSELELENIRRQMAALDLLN